MGTDGTEGGLRDHQPEWSFRLACVVDRLVAPRVSPGDGLVVNAFWRSGGTWIQEVAARVMGAKTVFEPLQPRAGYVRACLGELRPPRMDAAFAGALMPYADAGLAPSSSLHGLLDRALHGRLCNRFVHRGRGAARAALRRRVVVKLARGALMIPGLRATFGVPVLHVHRDPRAVVASIRRIPGWGEGAFDRLSLVEQLLEVGDGRGARFERWEREIRELEREDDHVRLAAYWALTERRVADVLAGGAPGVASLCYEDAVAAGPDLLLERLSAIGCRCPYPQRAAWRRTSTTTAPSRARLEAADRADLWVGELTSGQQEEIVAVATRFGLAGHLREPGAVSRPLPAGKVGADA